jgi:hypothetical protein
VLEIKQAFKSAAIFRVLPELDKRIHQLEKSNKDLNQ